MRTSKVKRLLLSGLSRVTGSLYCKTVSNPKQSLSACKELGPYFQEKKSIVTKEEKEATCILSYTG